MEDIKILVEGKVASVEGTPSIVCGNNDYTLSFTFSDEWNEEPNKVARFTFIKNGTKSFIDMPIHDDKCQVPVLLGIGLVRVGVYAGDLKTTTGARIGCTKSILCDETEEMAEPYINMYEELIKKINSMSGGSYIETLTEIDVEETYEDNAFYNANSVNGGFVYLIDGLTGAYTEINKLKEQQGVIDEVSLLVGGAE